jgi:hypothetical protein
MSILLGQLALTRRTIALGPFLALGLTWLVAGCATGRNPELLAAIKRAEVADIVVEVPPGIGEGLPDLNGVADKDKAPAVAHAVKSAVSFKVMGRPHGPEKARLRITLTGLSVASSAGRVLGSGSSLTGTARLETMNGQLIAHLGTIVGEDRATQGSGNIGSVIALAANIASASNEDRIQVLSVAFAEQVEKAVLGP